MNKILLLTVVFSFGIINVSFSNFTSHKLEEAIIVLDTSSLLCKTWYIKSGYLIEDSIREDIPLDSIGLKVTFNEDNTLEIIEMEDNQQAFSGKWKLKNENTIVAEIEEETVHLKIIQLTNSVLKITGNLEGNFIMIEFSSTK